MEPGCVYTEASSLFPAVGRLVSVMPEVVFSLSAVVPARLGCSGRTSPVFSLSRTPPSANTFSMCVAQTSRS